MRIRVMAMRVINSLLYFITKNHRKQDKSYTKTQKKIDTVDCRRERDTTVETLRNR